MKLGSLSLPKGTEITIPIAAVHHDKELWGEDARQFNPQRFSEGVSKAAKHPMAFMPFGLGPRICMGINFSMIEAKVVLAVMLQRFSFVLSPSYVHAPAQNFTISPQHGAQIFVNKLLL
jgi:cytochrome P450